MRARNIKPGFFKNEDLAEVPSMGRLLFIGLWCMADRAGRLEDRPRRIRAEIAPYDDLDIKKIDALLSALETRKFIIRYEVEEIKYIQIVNFTKHQHINIKESDSTIPAPNEHPTNTPEYPLLNTEYPNTHSGANTRFSAKKFEKEFEERFYPAYPKKRDPAKARTAYLKQAKNGTLPSIEILLAAIEDQKTWDDWTKDNGQYIPYPATWLNGERWGDQNGHNQRSSLNAPENNMDEYMKALEERERKRVESEPEKDIQF